MKLTKLLFAGILLTGSIASGLMFSNHSKKAVETFALDNTIAYVGTNKNTGYISADRNAIKDLCGHFEEIDLSIEHNNSIFQSYLSGQYADDITRIEILSPIRCDNCTNLFSGLKYLVEIRNLGMIDTSSCHSMNSMFSGCIRLANLSLNRLNTENVSDMSFMFEDCAFSFLDLSSFDVGELQNITGMFEDCSKLQTIAFPNFYEPSLRRMHRTFSGCSKLKELDLSSFDIENLEFADDAFHGCEPYIIKTPAFLPSGKTLDLYLPLYSGQERFYFDSNLNRYKKIGSGEGEAPEFTTIYLDKFAYIANDIAESFNIDTRFYMEDGEVTDLDAMSYYWSYSQHKFETEMEDDYRNIAFNVLNTATSATPMEEISKYVQTYDKLYNEYTSLLVDAGGDFLERCPDAGQPDGLIHLGYDAEDGIGYIANNNSKEILKSDYRWTFDESNARSGSIFETSEDTIDISEMNKIVIQNELVLSSVDGFFKNLKNVTEIEGISNLDVGYASDFTSMFEGCSSLQNLDLSSLDFDGVAFLDYMFKDCSSLCNVDISSIKISPGSVMGMFQGCTGLYELDLSHFNFDNTIMFVDMFKDASIIAIRTPNNLQFDIALPLGSMPSMNKFYDLEFNDYTAFPKKTSSMLLVSELVKHQVVTFCEDFNDECEAICEADGNSDVSKIIALWSDTADIVDDHYANGAIPWVMEFLKQDNSLSTCAALKEFSVRYDYIYSKYFSYLETNGGNFANRNLTSLGRQGGINIFYSDNTSLITTTVLVSLVICSFLVLVVFIQKKRTKQ